MGADDDVTAGRPDGGRGPGPDDSEAPGGPRTGLRFPRRRRRSRVVVPLVALALVGAAVVVTERVDLRWGRQQVRPAAVAGPDDGGAAAQAGAPGRATEPPADGREVCPDGRHPAASLRPSDEEGEAVRRIRAKDHLVVGVDQNSYLWGYRDPATGDITGFDIDLVQAIAEDLLGPHPRVVYRTIPTDQRLAAVRDGDVDMVVRTMSITCERAEQVSFSTAYFEAGQQVLAPRSSRIEGFDSSLEGQRVCTARGSTGQAKLREENHGSTPVYVENQLDCLVQLQLGRVDAVLTDNALAAGQAAQDPTIRLVGEPVTVEPYGVAMNQEDEDLVRRVNRVLEEYCEGGESSLWMKAYESRLADVMRDPDPAPPKAEYRD